MRSIWSKTVAPPAFPQLEKDISPEVAVIGGGMAGILCAAALRERGIDCAVLEANTVGSGITANTTAVLSVQTETLYLDRIRKHGAEAAKLLLDAEREAIERFRSYGETIPCDLENLPALTYSLRDAEKMKAEAAALRSLGLAAEFLTDTPLPFPVAGAVRMPETAQFHPLKFLYQLAKGLTVYENTRALRLEGTTVITDRAHVHAKQVIVATHFPFINRYGLYFLKMYQQRSFVVAYRGAPSLGCTIMDEAEKGIYLRSYGDLLLIGGGDRRPGKKGCGFAAAREFARQYYPQAEEVCAWGNQDCVTLDDLPYIGAYRSGGKGVYVTAGFGGWGMTGSMMGATVLADLVTGQKNRYAKLFDPARRMKLLPLLQNGGEAMLGLLTPKLKRCSHMGCALGWNEAEQSWDCPCHGSRFRTNGSVIDNPATHGIVTKKT